MSAPAVPREPYHNFLHRRLLHENIAAAAEEFGRGRLLDVGAGAKPYAPLFVRVDEYVGLDVEDRGGADVLGSASELPFPDESFDTVVSFQVLEHLPEPGALFSEAARVLKPGGHLILTAPFAWPIHEAPTDYFRFSAHGLRLLADAAGLEVVRLSPHGGVWTDIGTRASYFLYERSRRKGSFNRFVCRVIQRVCSRLDDRYPTPESTHNYSLVARKAAQ